MPARLISRFLCSRLAMASASALILSPLWLSPVWLAPNSASAQARSPRVERPELEVGVQGQPVAELQAVLKLLGFYTGAVSGTYSAETSQAVASFQDAAGIPVTGRVTTRTWNRLFPPAESTLASRPSTVSVPLAKPQTPILSTEPAAPAPKPATVTVPKPEPAKPARPAPVQDVAPNPFPILREGAEGDAVARLQNLLARLGVFDGVADGDFGPMTLEAVKAAQEKLGLEADGVVGPATWDALRR